LFKSAIVHTLPFLLCSGRCGGGGPDPLLTSGEQALVGSYRLDHVLLAPGKLGILPNSNQMFRFARVSWQDGPRRSGAQ